MHKNTEISEQLNEYKNLILKWNKVHNLISKNSENFIDERHIKDSMRIIPFLPKKLDKICDFGSGAGFPAIPMGIHLKEQQSNAKMYLYESRKKKTDFLEICKAQLKLDNIHIVNERIENAQKFKVDLITARAFANLKDIFKYSNGFADQNTIFLLHKGEKAEDEINNASKWYRFKYNMLDKNEYGGVILLASNLKAK